MAINMQNQLLEIGKIVNTHGIRGEVKVQPWCDDPYVFEELTYFYADGVRYEIQSARMHKNCVLVMLEGVTNMEQAERLKNKILKIEREALGELPSGVYYICDLLGLTVRTEEGAILGTVEDVLKTGSNDVYVLKSDRKHPILIPVIDDVVKEVNPAEGFITVHLIKGLIDDED